MILLAVDSRGEGEERLHGDGAHSTANLATCVS
jgi:hypothetical protein